MSGPITSLSNIHPTVYKTSVNDLLNKFWENRPKNGPRNELALDYFQCLTGMPFTPQASEIDNWIYEVLLAIESFQTEEELLDLLSGKRQPFTSMRKWLSRTSGKLLGTAQKDENKKQVDTLQSLLKSVGIKNTLSLLGRGYQLARQLRENGQRLDECEKIFENLLYLAPQLSKEADNINSTKLIFEKKEVSPEFLTRLHAITNSKNRNKLMGGVALVAFGIACARAYNLYSPYNHANLLTQDQGNALATLSNQEIRQDSYQLNPWIESQPNFVSRNITKLDTCELGADAEKEIERGLSSFASSFWPQEQIALYSTQQLNATSSYNHSNLLIQNQGISLITQPNLEINSRLEPQPNFASRNITKLEAHGLCVDSEKEIGKGLNSFGSSFWSQEQIALYSVQQLNATSSYNHSNLLTQNEGISLITQPNLKINSRLEPQPNIASRNITKLEVHGLCADSKKEIGKNLNSFGSSFWSQEQVAPLPPKWIIGDPNTEKFKRSYLMSTPDQRQALLDEFEYSVIDHLPFSQFKQLYLMSAQDQRKELLRTRSLAFHNNDHALSSDELFDIVYLQNDWDIAGYVSDEKFKQLYFMSTQAQRKELLFKCPWRVSLFSSDELSSDELFDISNQGDARILRYITDDRFTQLDLMKLTPDELRRLLREDPRRIDLLLPKQLLAMIDKLDDWTDFVRFSSDKKFKPVYLMLSLEKRKELRFKYPSRVDFLPADELLAIFDELDWKKPITADQFEQLYPMLKSEQRKELLLKYPEWIGLLSADELLAFFDTLSDEHIKFFITQDQFEKLRLMLMGDQLQRLLNARGYHCFMSICLEDL